MRPFEIRLPAPLDRASVPASASARAAVALAVALAATLLGYDRVDAAGAWSTRAPNAEARQEVGVAVLAGKIYMVGGFRGDASTAPTVEVYDPVAGAWSFIAPLPVALHHVGAASVGGKLYVIGGFATSFAAPVNTVYAYDPGTDQWSQKSSMPTARGGLAVAVVDGEIYAAGGSPSARETDFAVYDPATDTWTVLPAMPTPRNHHGAGALAGKFYAVGGRSASVGGLTDALEEYDPASGQWTSMTPLPTARAGIAATVLDGRLFVFGGEGNSSSPFGTFEEVEAYDPVTDTWQSLTPMPTPRHGIGAGALDGLIFIPGGSPVEGFGVTDVHEVLDPSGSATTTTTTMPPGAAACPTVPASDCFDAEKNSFQKKNNDDDARDQLKWRWVRGAATVSADFGEPTDTTAHALCVYDGLAGSFSLSAALEITPGGAWRDKSPRGWKYTDKLGTSDGVRRVQLRAGLAARSKALAKARGTRMPTAEPVDSDRYFAQDPAVIVQLVNTIGTCWTSEFTTARKNTSANFTAKRP